MLLPLEFSLSVCTCTLCFCVCVYSFFLDYSFWCHSQTERKTKSFKEGGRENYSRMSVSPGLEGGAFHVPVSVDATLLCISRDMHRPDLLSEPTSRPSVPPWPQAVSLRRSLPEPALSLICCLPACFVMLAIACFWLTLLSLL